MLSRILRQRVRRPTLFGWLSTSRMDSQYEMPVMTSGESRTYEIINKPTPPEKRSSNRYLISACVVGGVILLIISVTALVLSTTKREQSGQLLQNLTDQVSELMKKVHNSDSHLSEMEAELTARISSLHAKPVSANCSDGYLLNPYSNTCYALVRGSWTWQQAKRYCEAGGGYLATFETFDSASWFQNQRKTNPSWDYYDAWIGGQRDSDGKWRWYGRITGPITYSFWGPGEPNNGNESCLESAPGGHDSRFNDNVCSKSIELFCEKV